jgi:alpha-L-rhamnosidase
MALLLLLLPAFTAVHGQATDLLVDGLVSPLALDTLNPRFSWDLPFQYSYRILASLSPTFDAILWDSGEVISEVTSQHVYQGPPLSSDTDVWWVVSTSTSPTSMPINSTLSRFTMGLLNPTDWNGARWVGGYNQLKTNFTLPPAPLPTRARVYVTAVGFYELYVNGVLVCNDTEGRPTLYNPGFSTIYSTRVLYNAYDILPYLTPGTNVVGLRLGSGKYGYLGEFCTEGPTACNSGILSLALTPSSLLPTPLVTDGTWVGLPSPILFEDLYNGEVVDGRMALEQEGWSAPSSTLPGWAPVTVRPTPPTATLSASPMPGIVEYTQATAPVLLLPVAGTPDSFTWDLGLNGAGRCTLELMGPIPSGLNITLTLGEIMRPEDNSVNVAFHCPSPCCFDGGNCANQTFLFLPPSLPPPSSLSSQTISYTPTFAYSGFRYVQVRGWPPMPTPPPTLSSLLCTQTSTGVKGRGSVSFNASTPTGATLNAIQAIILRSQRSNLASIPTDCPQREKRGWMADASVTADEASLNFFMEEVYTNWLRTHSDTSAVGCGPLPKNWTCPKWHSDQPGEWAMDALGAGGAAGGVPNCYICCQGRPGFGCEPNTPTDTAGSIGDVIPFDKNGYGSFPGSIGWTSASFVVAGVLLKAYAGVEGLRGVYPGLAAHWKFYNRNAAANDPTKQGLVYWDAYGWYY